MQNSTRTHLRQIRQALNPSFQHTAACAIAQKLTSTQIFHASQNIALYLAFKGEVDLGSTLEIATKTGKNCYLPILANATATTPQTSSGLQFVKYRPSDTLRKNIYGIDEPVANATNTIPPTQLDLVIMPLVGFDSFGNRLGMGKGYYDKTFTFKKTTRQRQPYLVGVAYELQRLAWLNAEPWDVAMDMVITEELVYYNI